MDRMTRRSRRPIAVAALLGLPAMYAWSTFWRSTSVPVVVWGPVSFLLIGLTIAGGVVLYLFVRHRAELARRDLDERQRQLRDHAYIASYGVLATAVVALVGAMAVIVLLLGHPIVLDGELVSAVAICIGTLIPLLPVAALAWVEPDPLDDVA
jgi:hypothetical protein